MNRVYWKEEAGRLAPTLDGQPLSDGDAVDLALSGGRAVRCLVKLTAAAAARRSLALELVCDLAGGGLGPVTIWAPADALLGFAPPRLRESAAPIDEGGAYVGR